ncbi:MAG TPA: MFS transporter [Prolixibacteraceae bacterium]|nr:MFS transporter [Prolixibacteraceae bacterium]HPS12587.1 MFS transporter [Prolixibacteraceae bacterium]
MLTDNPKNTNLILLLFTGVLMGALDISIVGPAIPSIEQAIKIEPRMLGWIFSVYVLFNLVGISLFARLSDVFGRKNIYILSLSVFALGSLVVSLSDSFSVLIAGRAIQGFGASGIFPVASAIVGDLFPAEKRGRVLGLLGAVFGFAFIIGPILAGTMLHYFKWNVLFLINLPIAALLIVASLKILPNTKVETSNHLDWKGILGLGLMLGSFAYGINNIESESFVASVVSSSVLPFLIASLILFILTVYVERRAPSPIIRTSLFYNREIRIVGMIAMVTGILQASFVFIPNYAVGLYNVTSSTASFMLLPVVLATAIGSPLFGRMIDRVGSKVVIIIGLVLAVMGFYLLHRVAGQKVLFYGSGALIGFGLSVLSGSSLRYIMLNEVGKTDRAITQGMLTIFISLGQLTGAALIGVIIANASGVEGYRSIFLYESILLLVAVLFAVRLKSRKEEQESNKNR